MSLFTIIELLKNNNLINDYYITALKIWDIIILEMEMNPFEEHSKLIASHQSEFELNCGGKDLGKEIMAITAIARFYSSEIGFEHCIEEVYNLRKLMLASNCSLDVKWHLEKAYYNFGFNETNYPEINKLH
jgi:hypothetical protein